MGGVMVSGRDGVTVSYGSEAAVLLFADSAAGSASSAAAVEAVGARIGAALGIEGAAARLEEQAAVDAVMLDVSRDHGAVLDRLLDRLEHGVRARRFSLVVAMAPELIDPVAARLGDTEATLLCEPDSLERATAVGLALTARRHRLHDHDADGGTMRLRQLSEEVGRIARTLAALSDTRPASPPSEPPLAERRQSFTAQPSLSQDAAFIRAMIRARRMRDQFFDGGLFADPAWDMMLDLMAARLEQQRVAVSSLCIAAAVPPTTALRWIKTLTDAGLLVRVPDPHDARRVFIELSDLAAEGMAAYLATVRRSGVMAV